jgi:hypothetical protein
MSFKILDVTLSLARVSPEVRERIVPHTTHHNYSIFYTQRSLYILLYNILINSGSLHVQKYKIKHAFVHAAIMAIYNTGKVVMGNN